MSSMERHPADPGSAGPGAAVPRRRRRRDRHGRGMRGELAPRSLPMGRDKHEQFDDLVLDAVANLEPRWSDELAAIDFAVEAVPAIPPFTADDPPQWDDDVLEDGGVPLASVVRGPDAASPDRPMIVVYRRPLESRGFDEEDLADLVFEVIVDRLAHLLGKDPDEIDPAPTAD